MANAKDPEERYLETIEDRCVVGEVWEEFDTEGRTTWTVKDGERIPAPINEALVLSSQTTRTTPPSSRAPGEPLHRPVLDIDIPARLIPSTTPGHHHLYLGVDMTWRQYEDIINALANAKVIEEGYARAALNRKATFVRLPWVAKKEEDQ